MVPTETSTVHDTGRLADTWIDGLFRRPVPGALRAALRRTMSLDELEELYSGVRRSATAETFAPEALARLAIGLRIDDDDLARIPKTGPAIFVSNHPSGLLDGLLLDTAILRVRSDVKILANALLSAIPEIHSRLLPLDVLQNRDRRRNVRSMRAAVRHLQNGGAVVMFPAGEVSHIQFREFRISDPEWDDSVARLVRAKGATVIPVHVSASNSLAFQIASLMHPGLRTVRLAAELLNKRGRTVRIAVGSPIPGATVRALPSEQSAKEYLRGGTTCWPTGAPPASSRSAPAHYRLVARPTTSGAKLLRSLSVAESCSKVVNTRCSSLPGGASVRC